MKNLKSAVFAFLVLPTMALAGPPADNEAATRTPENSTVAATRTPENSTVAHTNLATFIEK